MDVPPWTEAKRDYLIWQHVLLGAYATSVSALADIALPWSIGFGPRDAHLDNFESG